MRLWRRGLLRGIGYLAVAAEVVVVYAEASRLLRNSMIGFSSSFINVRVADQSRAELREARFTGLISRRPITL